MATGERAVFFGLLIALLAVRFYYGFRQWRQGESSWHLRKISREREGCWGMPFRVVMFVGLIALLPAMLIDPPWLRWTYLPMPGVLRWLCAGFALPHLFLLSWAHHTIGRHWSTSLRFQSQHRLVTSGPYRWVRHPMYSALIGFFVGLVVLASNWLLLLYFVLVLVFILRRVLLEEAMLLEQFGDAYKAYIQSTGRWFPRLH